MADSTKATGKIESVDRMTGTAKVRLTAPKDKVANLHFGAFFSGRTARLPEKGDEVRVQLQDSPEGAVVVAARLLRR
jgi:hypothetical protein